MTFTKLRPMNVRILENAKILAGSDLDIVEGYLKLRDGVIEEIAKGRPKKSGIDMKGDFIIPPFVNGHTHVGDSVRTDLYQGRTQAEVVGEGGVKFDVLEESTEEEKIGAIRDSLRLMRDSGVLAHCDFRERGISGCRLIDKSSDESVTSVILSRPSGEDETGDLLSY